MITEDYVSFEVAKLLKEKGFDESTIFVYYDFLPSSLCFPNEKRKMGALDLFYYDETTQVNNSFNNSMPIPKYISGGVYSAPTIQMTMKWLREVHNIHIEVGLQENINEDKFQYRVKLFNPKTSTWVLNAKVHNWNTYEDACEAAIKYCLENLI